MPLGGKISGFGVTLENAPRWVISFVAVVATLTVVGGVYWAKVHDPERTIVTLREANTSLLAEVEEYNRHIGEVAESNAVLMDDVRGRLSAQRYEDGCLVLSRRDKLGALRSKLIVDLAKDMHGPSDHASYLPSILPVVEAAGRCMNPHPGNFTWSYGQKDGCWIQVWRRWLDGCTHVQMLDVCDGTWDPNIKWTQCVH